MQSPINTMSFTVFSENGYRCDFWIDKQIEHLHVLGKTDGIFVLGKTQSKNNLIDNKTPGVSQKYVQFFWFFLLLYYWKF